MRSTFAPAARLAGVAAALIAGLGAPATAGAAPYACAASAVSASVLGQPPVEPVVTGRGVACETRRAGGTDVVPALVSASALTAATALEGADRPQREQAATAAGGVSRLRVVPLPDLGLGPVLDQVLGPLREQVVSRLPDALQVPIPALTLPGPVPVTVPATTIVVDVRAAALAALGAAGRLTTADVVGLESAIATAGARCAGGSVTPVGAAQVSGLRVLGTDIAVADEVVQRSLTIADSTSISPASLVDALARDVPTGFGVTIPASAVATALAPLLAALPTVSVPAQVARVKVTPGGQLREGGALVQRAVRVEVDALGRSVLDLAVGEAIVGTAGVDCSEEVVGATASDLALACTTRRLVLIDVLSSRGRVVLFGAADRRLVGRRVDIVFHGTGRRVARTRVRSDGSFRTTAPLPARRLRRTELARYRAIIGRDRSRNLKLTRRMRLDSLTARNGKVRFRGRILGALDRPARPILLRRQVACGKLEVVGRFRPRRNGRFDITVRAPEGVRATVYRLGTLVRKNPRKRKLYPTFTLPRGVDLLS